MRIIFASSVQNKYLSVVWHLVQLSFGPMTPGTISIWTKYRMVKNISKACLTSSVQFFCRLPLPSGIQDNI